MKKMVNTFLGQKLDQTRQYTKDGRQIPVTLIKAGPCSVVQIKTKDKDGYSALQFGFGESKIKHLNQAKIGHLKKAGLKQKPRFLREVRFKDGDCRDAPPGRLYMGKMITVGDIFKMGDLVQVTGVSKGKGFAGVVKRHGFKGGPKTHGQSDRHRAPGSIGSTTTPGRVFKGKRMAGQMGRQKKTIKNLTVMAVNSQNNQLVVSGLVPGNRKSLLIIKKIGESKKFKI